jgi:UDP-N-acetylmuramoylalanine--D-glutamate ligase
MNAERNIIVGLGVTGYSCLAHLHGRMPILVVDTRVSPPFLEQARRDFPDVEIVCGSIDAEQLADAARILVSPGVALDSCLLRKARARGVPLESDIGLFLDSVSVPVVGITGTNGKSTVTALAGHLLNEIGGNAGVGGNIGKPALTLLQAPSDRYVLELSSFQLERLGDQHLDVAMLLNVSPDHLDRYPDFDAYAHSKQRIFLGSRVAIFNRDDPLTVPVAATSARTSVGLDAPEQGHWGIREHRGRAQLCYGAQRLIPVDELTLRGRHNHLNALAALALVQACGFDALASVDALAAFAGLEHRCQTVIEHDGVTYVNDSKATNPGAAVAALDGLAQQRPHILLIAGGDAKGASLDALGRAVRGRVKRALLLGRDADLLADVCSPAVPVTRVKDLREAVQVARGSAVAGDVILLSPACASLDMFDSFEARGRTFVAEVRREIGL